MRQPMYKCPKCGNTVLVFTKENIVQRTYKLRVDGEPYARQYETTEFYSDGDSERIECQACKNSVVLSDSIGLKKWRNPEYKPIKRKH